MKRKWVKVYRQRAEMKLSKRRHGVSFGKLSPTLQWAMGRHLSKEFKGVPSNYSWCPKYLFEDLYEMLRTEFDLNEHEKARQGITELRESYGDLVFGEMSVLNEIGD